MCGTQKQCLDGSEERLESCNRRARVKDRGLESMLATSVGIFVSEECGSSKKGEERREYLQSGPAMEASENPSINLAMESMISEQLQPILEETQNPRELIQLDSDAEVAEEVEEPDPQLYLNEVELREVQRIDVVSAIDSLWIKPKISSRFEVPLCRLIYMPLLRPIL